MCIKYSLKNLEKIYQQKYGVAVFSVKIKNVKGKIRISGEVLTENQGDDILNVFKKEKVKIEKTDLTILSDASKRNEIGFAVVKTEIADLKSRFVSNKILNNKILKRIKCSQAFKSEILRILFKKDDQLLVQQNDLTLGWVNRNEVIFKKGNLHGKWKCGNFALKNRIVKVKILPMENIIRNRRQILKQVQNDSNKILKEAEDFLGVEYVLGGKSKKGIDCSGLLQVVYKNSFNVILPKHSWDQKEMGKKINLKNVETGDLIFLIKKENSHKHVGIVEKNKTINLIHASLEKKKVIKQKLDEVFESYDFVEARRIVKY